MSTHTLDALAPAPPRSPDVRVTCDPRGGWQVDALVDGRVVATRHCDDWHRVERARRTLAAARPERSAARTIALTNAR